MTKKVAKKKVAEKKVAKKIQIQDHVLVSKHEKISEKEKKELFEKYNIISKELPKILIGDPAIADFDVKVNDIIRIIRTNKTAYETKFYRRVVNE